jgi:putative NADH-flavin reductase
MRILLFGATGMVGDGVLRWLITSSSVDQVVAVSRKPLQVRHPKLDTVIEGDMFHLQHTDMLQNLHACFFCLGASSIGLNKAEYRKLTLDLTLAV